MEDNQHGTIDYNAPFSNIPPEIATYIGKLEEELSSAHYQIAVLQDQLAKLSMDVLSKEKGSISKDNLDLKQQSQLLPTTPTASQKDLVSENILLKTEIQILRKQLQEEKDERLRNAEADQARWADLRPLLDYLVRQNATTNVSVAFSQDEQQQKDSVTDSGLAKVIMNLLRKEQLMDIQKEAARLNIDPPSSDLDQGDN